jgi:hypothetical protein
MFIVVLLISRVGFLNGTGMARDTPQCLRHGDADCWVVFGSVQPIQARERLLWRPLTGGVITRW